MTNQQRAKAGQSSLTYPDTHEGSSKMRSLGVKSSSWRVSKEACLPDSDILRIFLNTFIGLT